MKHTRHFRKRATAILTMLALLVSVVAAMGVLPLSADAASAPYTPKRVMSITSTGSEAEGKMLITASGSYLGEGKAVTVRGYYKVENYAVVGSGACVQIGPEATSGAISVTANTDGWVAFEQTYTTGDSNWLKYGFWYTTGTLSIADLTMTDGDGNVIYDMATDSNLVAGDIAPGNFPQQQGMWYLGYYNSSDNVSVHIDPVYEGSEEPVEPVKPVVTVTPVPEIPDLLAPDDNGYKPNRAFAIVSTSDAHPSVSFAQFAREGYLEEGKYYIFAKIRITDFVAHADAAVSSCSMLMGETVLATWTGNTDGWVDLTDDDGNLISFGAFAKRTDILKLSFHTQGAAANFAVADLMIANEKGDILYSLANDGSLNAVGDMRYTDKAHWDAWDATPETPTSAFPIRTRCNYVPNVSASLRIDDLTECKPFEDEAFIAWLSSNSLFKAGEKYTISGMIRVDVRAGIKNNVTPAMVLTGTDNDLKFHSTGGWVSLLNTDGSPVTFTATEEAKAVYIKFNFYRAHGTLSLADIVIRDSKGEVVWDMSRDAELISFKDKVTNGFVQKGELIKWFFYANAKGEGWVDVNGNPVDHTDADYLIPHFDEIAPVPSQPVDPEPTDPDPTDPDPTGDSIAVAAVLLAVSTALMGAAVTNRRKNRA